MARCTEETSVLLKFDCYPIIVTQSALRLAALNVELRRTGDAYSSHQFMSAARVPLGLILPLTVCHSLKEAFYSDQAATRAPRRAPSGIMVTAHPAREADQDRLEGRQPRPL